MTIDIFSTMIAQLIIPENKINNENIESISYGVCALTTSLLNIGVGAMLAYLFGMLFEYLVFVLFFVPISCKHSGFHCKTFLNCLILTNCLFMCSSWVCHIINFNLNILTIVCIILVHYFISKEHILNIHLLLMAIGVITSYFLIDINKYIFISLCLNIILMLGGVISERKNEKNLI